MNKFKEKPSILLTGSSGFLGTELVKALQDYSLFLSTRSSINGNNLTNNLVLDLSKNIEYLPSVDYVLHCAGKAHSLPQSEEEIEEFYRINFEGTKKLCEALLSLNVLPKALIFISTVAVYGLENGENVTEDHVLAGNSPYAKSKILAEVFLRGWADANGVVLGILRLPLICGPNPPGNLGYMINAIKNNRYFSIGKADARKSLVWAADIAQILPRITVLGGTYNLTDGFHPSLKELENTIAKCCGKLPPIKIPLFIARVLGKFGDITNGRFPVNSEKIKKLTSTLTFDDSKARKEIGWCPSSVITKLKENL